MSSSRRPRELRKGEEPQKDQQPEDRHPEDVHRDWNMDQRQAGTQKRKRCVEEQKRTPDEQAQTPKIGGTKAEAAGAIAAKEGNE